MEKKRNYYTGLGLVIGTGVAGVIAITVYALTGNSSFISFIGVGTALGLAFGAALDAKEKSRKG